MKTIKSDRLSAVLAYTNWYHKCKGLRKGQSLMNAFARYFPKEYTRISGTFLDCFYDDSKYDYMLKYIEDLYSEQQYTSYDLVDIDMEILHYGKS